METVSENTCFGGVQGVYTHRSTSCACDMTFGLFLPEEARDGPVPLLWYLSGLTCTDENLCKATLRAPTCRRQRCSATTLRCRHRFQ